MLSASRKRWSIRTEKASDWFRPGRLRIKLTVGLLGSEKFGVVAYFWKNCCMGAKISACGILLQATLPAGGAPPGVNWYSWPAMSGNGLPAASQRNWSRTKVTLGSAPTARVEYGLKIL